MFRTGIKEHHHVDGYKEECGNRMPDHLKRCCCHFDLFKKLENLFASGGSQKVFTGSAE
jgi:hypothetical protein